MNRIDLPEERQVGHLKLLRKGRQISLQEYNALTADERMEMVRAAQGKKKLDLLLSAVDAERLTRQLHPQELYLTINELGSADANELLMLASSKQLTTLLDLDCWDGDQVSPVLSLHWLQLLLTTGPELVCRFIREIEPEILALFLKKHLTIIRGIEVFDDDDADNAKRLESLYDIEYASEDAAKIIGALLNILQEQEQETYLLLMEMVRSEISASLEEEVYQDRNNRLCDLGLIPTAEAKSIYSLVDPERFTPGGKSDFRLEAEAMPHPGALLQQATPGKLLAEALSNKQNNELATELCLLINRKMSADATDIADRKQLTATVQEVYDILNLALEHQAGSDLLQAEQLLDNTYLLHLFQLGHSLLQQLQTTAARLLNGPLGKLFDYPEQLFLDTLQESPPALYREATSDTPSELISISTMKTWQEVRGVLQQIEDLQRLFTEVLPFPLPETEEESAQPLSLSMLFMTAIANQLLGRDFSPEPLAGEDLILLQSRTIKQDQLDAGFIRTLQQIPQKENLNCINFIRFCLECWYEDLAHFDLAELERERPLCLLLNG